MKPVTDDSAGGTPAAGRHMPTDPAPTPRLEPAGPPRRKLLLPVLAGAAVIAMTAGSALLGLRTWQARPDYSQAISSPPGQPGEVALPDGTIAQLDSNTSMEVSYYRNRREVKMVDGQVVFDVKADAARPFRLVAGPLTVTGADTRYALRFTPGLPGDDAPRIAVQRGAVQAESTGVKGKRPPEGASDARWQAKVASGQQVRIDADGSLGAVATVAADDIAPWQAHRVRFENRRLDGAIAEFSRYGDRYVAIRDPAVAALRLSGQFDLRDQAGFLRSLPLTLPVTLAEVKGVTEIRSAETAGARTR